MTMVLSSPVKGARSSDAHSVLIIPAEIRVGRDDWHSVDVCFSDSVPKVVEPVVINGLCVCAVEDDISFETSAFDCGSHNWYEPTLFNVPHKRE